MKKSGWVQLLLVGIVAVILLALVVFLKGILFPGGGGGEGGGGDSTEIEESDESDEQTETQDPDPEQSTGPIEITIDGRSYFLNGKETSITEIVKEAESQGKNQISIIRKENSQYAEEEALQTALESSGFIVDMTDENENQ